jgi:hypothetical protein
MNRKEATWTFVGSLVKIHSFYNKTGPLGIYQKWKVMVGSIDENETPLFGGPKIKLKCVKEMI